MSAYIDPLSGQPAELPDLQPGRLIIDQNEQPTPPPPSETLIFGRTFTDHMLTAEWSAIDGWEAPHIKPYGPLSLAPSASVLHYAQTLFEGMKAYRTEDDRILLFRPDMNMKRMNNSARRVALPTFNEDSLLELIKKLVRMDRHWVPKEPGHSLYIRPTLIASQKAIQVSPPTEALLFVICSPVGPYFPKPVSLYATTEYIRAAPGGQHAFVPTCTGAFKLGVNYAPAVMPQKMVAEKGYSQNLWLHGPEHYLTEVGTMNMFIALRTDDGGIEVVTPPLDGMILPGVTRDSVLQLMRDHVAGIREVEGLPDKLIISERSITMKEVKEAAQSNRLVELFGAGTAAIISPVLKIGYLGEDIEVPTGADGMGPIARAIRKTLAGIQWGKIPHPWYATLGSTTFVAKPPPAPPLVSRADEFDNLVLEAAQKIRTAASPAAVDLLTLVNDYDNSHGTIISTSLAYESRPTVERRVDFRSTGIGSNVVLVAHCLKHGEDHRITLSSGFRLNAKNSEPLFATCAHTLVEIRNSSLFAQALMDSSRTTSGSFIITEGDNNTLTFHPVFGLASTLHRSDLLILSTGELPKKTQVSTLPLSPYPAHPQTAIRAHFVAHHLPDEPGWTPWIGGTWSKWVRGEVLGYRDFAGREALPGTYDALSHLLFRPPPSAGSSGGPLVDEESGAVVGIMLGTRMDNRIEGVRGWGVPSEAIYEMFQLPGLEGKK
ncbi:hypothetical protein ONZ45_g9612 [Pleurotus djamor]|nr:hypothetical protein ONZ45_g9612 [Pleurotus djamor]